MFLNVVFLVLDILILWFKFKFKIFRLISYFVNYLIIIVVSIFVVIFVKSDLGLYWVILLIFGVREIFWELRIMIVFVYFLLLFYILLLI